MSEDETIAERLRRAGMWVTAPRLAVMAAVADCSHQDADAIAAAARARLGTLSTHSVHDNLRALIEAGFVRRIEPAGHPARYGARVGDNHITSSAADAGGRRTSIARSARPRAWSRPRRTASSSTRRK